MFEPDRLASNLPMIEAISKPAGDRLAHLSCTVRKLDNLRTLCCREELQRKQQLDTLAR